MFFLISKDKPYVRHHSAEALNFQITYTIVMIVGVIVMFAGIGVTGGFGDDDPGVGFAVGFTSGFGLLMMLAVGHVVLSILGAVKAAHMEWWRYPVNLRLVKP